MRVEWKTFSKADQKNEAKLNLPYFVVRPNQLGKLTKDSTSGVPDKFQPIEAAADNRQGSWSRA
jgi:hypothetical protein